MTSSCSQSHLSSGRDRARAWHHSFLATGRKLDRSAIVGLERDALGFVTSAAAFFKSSGVTSLLSAPFQTRQMPSPRGLLPIMYLYPVRRALKRPFRIYGTFCRVADVATSWRFCQIPDEILAQMHIVDDFITE